jgi:hypothetical protein
MRHAVGTVPTFAGPSTVNDYHLMGTQRPVIIWLKICELPKGYLATVLRCSC